MRPGLFGRYWLTPSPRAAKIRRAPDGRAASRGSHEHANAPAAAPAAPGPVPDLHGRRPLAISLDGLSGRPGRFAATGVTPEPDQAALHRHLPQVLEHGPSPARLRRLSQGEHGFDEAVTRLCGRRSGRLKEDLALAGRRLRRCRHGGAVRCAGSFRDHMGSPMFPICSHRDRARVNRRAGLTVSCRRRGQEWRQTPPARSSASSSPLAKTRSSPESRAASPRGRMAQMFQTGVAVLSG